MNVNDPPVTPPNSNNPIPVSEGLTLLVGLRPLLGALSNPPNDCGKFNPGALVVIPGVNKGLEIEGEITDEGNGLEGAGLEIKGLDDPPPELGPAELGAEEPGMLELGKPLEVKLDDVGNDEMSPEKMLLANPGMVRDVWELERGRPVLPNNDPTPNEIGLVTGIVPLDLDEDKTEAIVVTGVTETVVDALTAVGLINPIGAVVT